MEIFVYAYLRQSFRVQLLGSIGRLDSPTTHSRKVYVRKNPKVFFGVLPNSSIV